MPTEAEANAEADKKERERVDKMNQADSMIFQTENQLKEIGDKIPAQHKPAIEQALQQLKDAHKAGDIAAIDNAINALNAAWQTASQQMYQGAQGAQAGPQDNPFAGQQQAQQEALRLVLKIILLLVSNRLSRRLQRMRTSRMPTSRRSNKD